MKLTDWNITKKDYIYLIIILLFSLITIFYRLKFHMSGGIFSPDKALYLINALQYGGMDYYNIYNPGEITASPILSFLTSLLFRIGIVNQVAISLVSAFFAILGYIGLYLLLKRRFDSLLSFTGVIIFGSFSEILINLASGLTDLPSVSISIWILLISIIAIDKNYKYFIYLFPLLVIGFFTRYTVGLMIPVILIYYLMKRNFIDNLILLMSDYSLVKNKLNNYINSQEFRYILISIFLAGIMTILIIKFLILNFGGSLTFIEQSQNTFNGKQLEVKKTTDFLLDKLFYVKNFSKVLFNEERPFNLLFVCFTYAILIIGLLIKFISIFKKLKIKFIQKSNTICLLSLIVALICSFVGFEIFSNHMVSNIFLLISLLLFYYLFKEYSANKDNFAFFILYFGYFFINLIFISVYQIKVLRYALPLLPAFIFFLILALESILDYIKNKFNNNERDNEKGFSIVNIIPILIIVILAISTISLIEPMEIEGYPNSLVDACNYIKTNDPNYHSKTFSSNNHNYRLIKWNLDTNVDYVNEKAKMLDLSNTTYIIDLKSHNYKNYHEIYNNSDYHIYYHN